MKTSILLLIVLVISSLVLISYAQKVHIGDLDVQQHENEVDYDQDEFEGFEASNKPTETTETIDNNIKESSSAPSEGTDTETEVKVEKKKVTDFILEICFIIFLITYAINFFVGKNTNRNIVKLWGKKFQPLFDENFAKVGNKNNFTILKVNSNTFTFVCSGRNNCHGAQVTLDLKKRQDLLSVFLDLVGYSEPDKMTIEVALTGMDPIVFAVIRSKALKKFKTDHSDVDLFCSKYNYGNLSNNYAVLADTEVLPSLFLNQEVIDVLNSNESLFESMLFTDHSSINPKYPKAIQGVFKFKAQDIDKLYKLGQMMILFIDYVSTAELPKQAKAKADKLRVKAKEELSKQKHAERQEEAMKKKYEKAQKEKEAVSKLTPDEQRRYNEKEHKKQLKKRSGKGKVVLG